MPANFDSDLTQEQSLAIEEMESVLYSISFGKLETYGTKTKYQAFSAAINNQNHVDLVLRYIGARRTVQQAKSVIVAYRVNTHGTD